MPQYSVEQVIQRGYYIINRKNPPTYSMPQRGSTLDAPHFDCSSFMGTINGVGEGGWPPATPSMKEQYAAHGYIPMPFNPVLVRKGDVLVYNKPGTDGAFANGHTAMFIGNVLKGDYRIMEMVGNYPGGNARDNGSLYSRAWQWMLRNPKSGFYPIKWVAA